MKKLYFIFYIFLSISVYSQSIKNINVTGRVIDTLGETIPAATVMLLNSNDSTLVNYTTTDSYGNFNFRSVRNIGYLLKISHISFMPLQKNIPVHDKAAYDFGNIEMQPIAEVLMEVVIKSAQAPLFIHGDTVEYDARLFKVPPGSTVEDLLKRLPGIVVDEDGGITSNGKDVGRIYVDGKTFFGDDPKSVTKNLDAEAVARVQVYDEKSEQERLTGIKDGSDSKAMNLELKDEYKKGYFGKASIAAGTEQRWAGRGSYNKFNETSQLSFIGYGNNINATGVNWDDYQEFKGSSAYSDYDNGDFGFTRRNYRHFSFMNSSGYSDKGFTENYGGGVNYNYFKEKVKFNLSYFYNQSNLHYDLFSKRQTFLTDSSFFRYDTTDYNSFSDAHSISSRLEIEFDSTNTLILRVNSRISGNLNESFGTQLFQTSSPSFLDINLNSSRDSTDIFAYSVNALSIYNHKFKKKGRSISLSGAIDVYENKTGQITNNINEFYLMLTPNERINYLYDNTNSQRLYKSSLMYVEPLNKRFSLMSFYNFSKDETVSGKIVQDIENSNVLVNSMTNFYIHDVLYNRLGTGLTYAWQGLNITLGGAYQLLDLSGRYALLESSENYSDLVPRTFSNFIPYFRSDWQLPNNMKLNLSYVYDVDEPEMSQLQPITDNSNPLYNVEGNLNLVPEISHSISGGLHYWNQASFSSFAINANASFYENSITYNQNTEFVDGVGYVTTSKPENVQGGQSVYAYCWGNIPIIKTVLSMNIWGNVRFSENPIFINSIENLTKSNYYLGSIGLNLNIGPKLSFSVDADIHNNIVRYSIQTDQNQRILRYGTSAGIKWQFLKKTYLEGNIALENYTSDKLYYNNDILLSNLSIRQILGKKNQFEIRLAGFDLFNQNIYLVQVAFENYTSYSVSPTLARYFMLSVAYNLKGFETKMKNGKRW